MAVFAAKHAVPRWYGADAHLPATHLLSAHCEKKQSSGVLHLSPSVFSVIAGHLSIPTSGRPESAPFSDTPTASSSSASAFNVQPAANDIAITIMPLMVSPVFPAHVSTAQMHSSHVPTNPSSAGTKHAAPSARFRCAHIPLMHELVEHCDQAQSSSSAHARGAGPTFGSVHSCGGSAIAPPAPPPASTAPEFPEPQPNTNSTARTFHMSATSAWGNTPRSGAASICTGVPEDVRIHLIRCGQQPIVTEVCQ